MENKEKRASGQQQRLEAVRPSMPDTSVLYDLSDFFKVMGDGTRIQLLWALEQGELCVGDLAEHDHQRRVASAARAAHGKTDSLAQRGQECVLFPE